MVVSEAGYTLKARRDVPCPKCKKPLRVATVDARIGLECASSDCGYKWPKEEEK